MNSRLFVVGILFLILNSCQVIRFKNNSKNKFLNKKEQSSVDVSLKKIFAKGKIILNSRDKKQSLDINIKTKKDSIIMFSVLAPFGIEVFRGQITNDSIYFIDRVNKKYQINSRDSLNIIGLPNYKVKEIINILFLADDIVPQQNQIEENHKEKESIIFKKLLGQQPVKITYSDYRYVEKINIPFSLVINIENMNIKLNYTQIGFLDKLKTTKFKIPKGYEK